MIHANGLWCGGNWRAGELETDAAQEPVGKLCVFPRQECVKTHNNENTFPNESPSPHYHSSCQCEYIRIFTWLMYWWGPDHTLAGRKRWMFTTFINAEESITSPHSRSPAEMIWRLNTRAGWELWPPVCVAVWTPLSHSSSLSCSLKKVLLCLVGQ